MSEAMEKEEGKAEHQDWEQHGRFRVRRKLTMEGGSFRDAAEPKASLAMAWREQRDRTWVDVPLLTLATVASLLSFVSFFESFEQGMVVLLLSVVVCVGLLQWRLNGPGMIEGKVELEEEDVVIHRGERRRSMPRARVERVEVRRHAGREQTVLRSGTRAVVVYEGDDLVLAETIQRELTKELEA